MIERWLSSNRPIQIEHDGRFTRGGAKSGQPIEVLRQELIQEEVEAQIEVKPLKLRQHFLQQGNFQDAEKVEQVDGTVFQGKRGRLLAEVNFAGTSFLEGFLSMYGMELDQAVKRYEEKLQLFEVKQREKKQKVIFIGRVRKGDLEQLSEGFPTVQEAKRTLSNMQQQKEIVPQQFVEMKREE
ncbi:MAG: hypothetical protein RR595_15140 [Lysinibacillus sp.]